MTQVQFLALMGLLNANKIHYPTPPPPNPHPGLLKINTFSFINSVGKF